MRRWVWVLGLLVLAGCTRKPSAPSLSPLSHWSGALQATFEGGQSVEAPSGAWVGVEGMTFRNGGILEVEVSSDLPPALEVYRPYLASEVVTLRFRKEDLAFPELSEGVRGIEGLLYGIAVALPLRRNLSSEWGNVVVVADGVPTVMPYATALQAGEVGRVRIPIATLSMLTRPGENELVIFFAEGQEQTLSSEALLSMLPPEVRNSSVSLQAVVDKYGYPFRLKVEGNEVKQGSGGIPYSVEILVGKRFGVFDPVAVFFSNGLNVFSFWSPVPCGPVEIPGLIAECSAPHGVLTAIYQKLSNRIGADMAKKLVGFYNFQHSGHEGFGMPAAKLWERFNRSYVDEGALGGQKHRVLLTGFSMGGLVSRNAAVMRPDAVLGVGSINTPHLGSIIADLVTYQDREGDLIDYVAREAKNRLGLNLIEYARFWLELRDPRRTYIPIAGVSEVFHAGTTGVLGIPLLAPAQAITPLRYVPKPGDPYIRVCVSVKSRTVDIPDPTRGDDIAALMGAEQGAFRSPVRLHAYMTRNLPGKPGLTQPIDLFQWILGNFMAALDFSGPCDGLYPSSPYAYANDGLVARKSGLFDHPANRAYQFSTQAASLDRFHLSAPNPNEIGQWANTLAGWIEDYLKNEWMRDYRYLYELAWEYLFSTGSIDLEFYALFRNNSLTLDYLLGDQNQDGVVRRWQEFYTYAGVSQERHGMVGTGISRNAGPEGIALRRNSNTTPKVYLVAAVKSPPLVALDLKAKFHIFEKPNATSLSGVRDTLIETTKQFTRFSSDLYWIIGELDQSGRFVREINRWVGVRELDHTARTGNITCYWKVRVLDYQNASGMPIKDNYPILEPTQGVPVRKVRCETTGLAVAAEEVHLR